jgi:hypothetical protein
MNDMTKKRGLLHRLQEEFEKTSASVVPTIKTFQIFTLMIMASDLIPRYRRQGKLKSGKRK